MKLSRRLQWNIRVALWVNAGALSLMGLLYLIDASSTHTARGFLVLIALLACAVASLAEWRLKRVNADGELDRDRQTLGDSSVKPPSESL